MWPEPCQKCRVHGAGRSGSKATEPNLTTNGQAPKPCPGYLPLQGFCKPPFSSNSWTFHQSPEWRDRIESHASSFPCQLNLTIKPFLFSKAGATVLAYMQIWAASPLLDNKTLFSILLCIYLEQSKLQTGIRCCQGLGERRNEKLLYLMETEFQLYKMKRVMVMDVVMITQQYEYI